MEMGPSPPGRPVCASLYLLLLGSHVLIVSGVKTSSNLLCYSEKSGSKMQNCHSSFGFKTCFTKYNYKNDVVLRGCSSRRKMFHVECESHLSGVHNQQICYCSFDLCNELSSVSTIWRNSERKVQAVILWYFAILLT